MDLISSAIEAWGIVTVTTKCHSLEALLVSQSGPLVADG